jgi:tetratricopeptide (TPR) repeat protein
MRSKISKSNSRSSKSILFAVATAAIFALPAALRQAHAEDSRPVAPVDADVVPSPFATAFDDPQPQPPGSVEAATFNGVQAGETTARQLAEKWGEGKLVSHENGELVLGFSVDSFPHVEATLVDDKVRTIVVNLQQPSPPETIARKLHVENIRPVNVPDETGAPLGQAYPERGILFSTTQDGKRVSQVVMEKVDPASFLLRAEADWQSHSRASLADLDFVLSRNPHDARALWLRGKVLALSARYDEAMADVDEALSLEPNQGLYRLTRGEILGKQGQFEQATQETKNVLSAAGTSDELKAMALCQLGDLIAADPSHDYKLALDHHMSAIKLADPLSIDRRFAIRRAAKLLLIDAHLSVASDIACGNWQQKEKVTAKWLDRAEAYAEEMIAHEDGDPALRLHVSAGALAACAGAQGKIDSVPWARMALQQGKPLIAATDDSWTKQHLAWDLGVALSDGLIADEAAGAAPHALPNTSLTITFLETGAKARRETADDAFRLGEMYYRLGALHAVKQTDHKTAVAWYEKAYPLLDRPIPPSHTADQGHYGDWLVSMGISYWEVGMHDFALQLTDAGLQHLQEAVNRKLADEKALAVPYSNLAFMHQALGHKNESQSFTQMAAKYDGMQPVKH